MASLNWQKQTLDSPLYEDIIWEKPENKRISGRFLIVGGNTHEFASSAQIFESLKKAGGSNIFLALPDVLKKIIDNLDLAVSYLPSNPSGSIGLNAVAELIDLDKDSDIVILAQDLGKNSETTLCMDHFLNKNESLICITSENIDLIENIENPDYKKMLLVTNFSDLQKLLIKKFNVLIKNSDEFFVTLNKLHDFNIKIPLNLMCVHEENIIVVADEKISTTNIVIQPQALIEKLSAFGSFYLVNNQSRIYQALTSAVFEVLAKK